MELRLISSDRDLHKLCREILFEIFGQDSSVAVVKPEEHIPGSALSLWDFHRDVPLPNHIAATASRQLFLIHRNDLAAFYQKPGAKSAPVLLKPVTRATLSAFLSFAAAVDGHDSAFPRALRADRDDILQCLIQTNLRLQEYDQYRTNFLARAMHDFRSPLTALCGYCDFLLAEPLGPLNEQQKEVLRRMLHSTKRLSRMATAMFQLSVGRQLKPRLDRRKGDLRDCVEQALHEIGPFAEEKRIGIAVDLVASGESLYFEAKQVEQLLINLLDNACKFTPKAGTIEIRGYPYFWERRRQPAITIPKERRHASVREPNAYRVDIHDSGGPIPQDRLELIFEEYVSYGDSSERISAGLGLAICRSVVTNHDGAIWAENDSSGPTFSFVLPFHSGKPISDQMRDPAYSEVA
jgi:signal transduction histidine kinase